MKDNYNIQGDILRRKLLTSIDKQLERIAEAMERQAAALERLVDRCEEFDNDERRMSSLCRYTEP